MPSDGPPLLRPTPRRPFDLNLTSATPPETSTPPSPDTRPQRLEAPSASGAETPGAIGSRTRSILNLTSSTLFGIYSPTGYSNEREEPSTPWGTGAETPRDRGSIDAGAPTFASRTRAPLHRRRSSQHVSQTTMPNYLFSLFLRITLLFCLGMGYGLLVTHLHDDRKVAPFQVEGIIKPSYNWPYLVFWGVAGIGLGSLLPYVDTLWEENLSSPQYMNTPKERASSPEEEEEATPGSGLAADWTPVVRSIGAFVGIAFAIRKLPWASTLQVSLTLLLVNPVLWYLVDRSKPGFLLSTSISVVGTVILTTLNPEMMPSPASHPQYFLRNSTTPPIVQAMGGLVAKETIECGTWIISVLFCSCVCFGNIGRRLALQRGSIEGTLKPRRDSFR